MCEKNERKMAAHNVTCAHTYHFDCDAKLFGKACEHVLAFLGILAAWCISGQWRYLQPGLATASFVFTSDPAGSSAARKGRRRHDGGHVKGKSTMCRFGGRHGR